MIHLLFDPSAVIVIGYQLGRLFVEFFNDFLGVMFNVL